jgi:ribosomal protein S13
MTESDLSGYAPTPMEGEEHAVALSLLVDGIGPAKAKNILKKFEICLEPRLPCTFLDDCDGIGKILAESVGKAIKIDPSMITRPKIKKAIRKA